MVNPAREWAAYVRVSRVGDRQGDAYQSPDLQRRAVAHLAPVREFVDEDTTGRNFDRAGIKAALAWLHADPTRRGLALKDLTRLGRNLIECATVIRTITAAGGELYSSEQRVDTTTAEGTFMLHQFLAVAEYQSNVISANWRRTLAYRVSQGKPATGRRRFGYVRQDDSYTPDPVTGPVLASLYHRYAQGTGAQSLVRDLNAEGHRTTRGGEWTVQTLYRVLDSGFGAGLLIRGHANDPVRAFVPGVHPQVITPDEWQAYRRARERRRQLPARSQNPTWALAGLVVCGRCSARMKKAARGMLVCSRYAAARTCPGSWITMGELDTRVVIWIGGHLDEVAALVPSWDRARGAVQTQARDAETALTEAEAALSRLAAGYAQGLIDEAGYRGAQSTLLAERDARERELTRLRDELELLAPVERDALDRLENAPDMTPAEWGRQLARVIRRVEIHPREIVVVPVLGQPVASERRGRRKK